MFRRPIAHRADVSSYTLQRSWGMPLIFALRKQVPVITVDGADVCLAMTREAARRQLIRCPVEKTPRPRRTPSSLTGCGMHGRSLARSISDKPNRLYLAAVRRSTLAPRSALPTFAVRKIGSVTGLPGSKLSVCRHFISHLGSARPYDGRCGQFLVAGTRLRWSASTTPCGDSGALGPMVVDEDTLTFRTAKSPPLAICSIGPKIAVPKKIESQRTKEQHDEYAAEQGC